MHITAHILRAWADDHRIPDLMLAELDYRLTYALDAIYSHPFLRERLYLKGGTALNKLFFPAVNRLSVDLDFNAVGPKTQVLAERAQLTNQIMTLLASQDTEYRITHDYRLYEQSTIRADFTPVSGGSRQHLKLEISFVERVPIFGRENRVLASTDSATRAAINTYRLEELAATKLRALYARRKGRDIYDLAQIAAIDLNEQALRKLTLYYFYHARMIFHYTNFRAKVEEKLNHRGFADDVRGLIRVDQQFNWQKASQAVLDRFTFLADLDERDREFLTLARYLLGGHISERETEKLAHIEHPIARLMENCAITAEAAALRQEDIRVFGVT